MRKLLKTIDHGNNIVENHYDDGRIEWLKDGLVDRNDEPAIEKADGTKQWFKKGSLHREAGPAVENINGKFWYLNGKPHRDDGPSSEYAKGGEQWHIHGRKLSEQEINAIKLSKELNKNLDNNNLKEKKPKI